jgi:hypothetical protein
MTKEDKFAEEMLTDEELDGVAGGSVASTAYDSEFLYEHGLVDHWHSTLSTFFMWGSYSAAVDAGWAKAGITCVTKPWGDNLYLKDGKEISRDEAYNYVRNSFPKVKSASNL